MRIERFAGLPEPGRPGLSWLGQAGFWIETGDHRILIDPYLSDSLALKYAGKPNDHRRMMPPPIRPEDLPEPDFVLVTHAHGDHMDAGTLAPLAARFPRLRFVVPAAKRDLARERIGAAADLVAVDAGETLEPLPGLTIRVVAAAHETLERDASGRHLFLGYGIRSPRFCVYHSGDTVPYPGLDEAVRDFAPDVVLLPVNGRDAHRLANGIPGNLTLHEAITLARKADSPYLVPHHFGMFAFNMLDEADIDAAALSALRPVILKPKVGETLSFDAAEGGTHGSDRDDRTRRQSA